LSQANLKTDLAALIKYKTRYYKSSTGATAASDLKTKLQSVSFYALKLLLFFKFICQIASSAPGTGGAVTISSFSHSWGMPTIIARIEGKGNLTLSMKYRLTDWV
jgi:bacterial leucyl aminopeptidase